MKIRGNTKGNRSIIIYSLFPMVLKACGVFLTCFSATGRTEQQQLVHDHVDNNTEENIRRRRVAPTTAVDEKPLAKIADAFKELANVVISENVIEVAAFARACSSLAPLFGSVDFHFEFIEVDYFIKVNDIAEASKSFETLQSMVDHDVQTNTVKKQGSHSRNLLKITRALEFLKVLYEQVMLTEGNSMKDAVSKAYAQIFHSHHGWAIRKAVSIRIHYIPTKQQLYRKLGEDEPTAWVLMETYISAFPHVLQHIEKIFLDRELGIDW